MLRVAFLVLLACFAIGCGSSDGSEALDDLWLRQDLISDSEKLAQYRRAFARVDVVAHASVDKDDLAQLRTAAEELSAGLTRLLGRNVLAYCCNASQSSASEVSGTLHVEVGKTQSSLLGYEGFEIGRSYRNDVVIRAWKPSGALYGSFRLLQFVQRSAAVPGECTIEAGVCTAFNDYRSIPQMELRIWDLWDDVSGDITRGYAGDSLIWPMATWRDPNIQDGPPPRQLYVEPCDKSQRLQHWSGKLLSEIGSVSRLKNGDGLCLSSSVSPTSVIPCGSIVGDDNASLFWYNASSKQISVGPVVHGVSGGGRTCLDVDHAAGPNVGRYRCHVLYPDGRGELDYQHQQFQLRVLDTVDSSNGETWYQLESVSAPGQCMTLRNSYPPSPFAPAGVIFSARLVSFLRLLKSIGINGVVLNDVNACYDDNGDLLLSQVISNISQNLGSAFARYAITPYLSVCFGAPLNMAGISADPLNSTTQQWWATKANELWSKWPNFGGFLVKADSEGDAGPLRYNRTQADGANLLARAVAPHGGIVIWRAFVYGNKDFGSQELVRQSYSEFKPLDGFFDENVILQIKNGPMDFQIREPLHPLLGAMKHSNVMMEVQAAQEYTGQQIHAVNLVTMWSEYLEFDTLHEGPGSTIRRLLSNTSLPTSAPGRHSGRISGIACVSNFGSFANWTGHVLAASNTFGFGRLAWSGGLSAAEDINREWTQLTFPARSSQVIETIVDILQRSRSVYEGYTSPLGIGFIVFGGGNYKAGHGACVWTSPGPGDGPYGETCPASPGRRLDWHGGLDHYWVDPCSNYGMSNYSYDGLGCDRSTTSGFGTGYAGDYAPANRDMYNNVATTPKELLLWFHHLPWTHPMVKPDRYSSNDHSGAAPDADNNTISLYEYIRFTHFDAVQQASELAAKWNSLEGGIDEHRFKGVQARFSQQLHDAAVMRDAILVQYKRWYEHGIGMQVRNALDLFI